MKLSPDGKLKCSISYLKVFLIRVYIIQHTTKSPGTVDIDFFPFLVPDVVKFTYMWCDQAKSVWSRSNSVFIFLTNCMHHFHSYILQKTPLKLVDWFQRYEQLKDAENNRKQNTFFCFVWLYLKINISDFRLILLDHITYSRHKAIHVQKILKSF